jgi:hypothetical protein
MGEGRIRPMTFNHLGSIIFFFGCQGGNKQGGYQHNKDMIPEIKRWMGWNKR